MQSVTGKRLGSHVLGSASARTREYVGRQLSLTKVLRSRRGLEVLIRKLLNLPSRPAVLMLNLWMPSFNRYSYWEARRPSFVPNNHVTPIILTRSCHKLYSASADIRTV